MISTGAGKMNRRCTLERETRLPDGAGGYTRTWDAYATVWGDLTVKSGNEKQVSEQQTNVQEYMLRIRYRRDVLPADRVVIQGAAYNVRNVFNNDQKRRFLMIRLQAGVAV